MFQPLKYKMKIGIIGAGAAGLVALRHSLKQGHECVVFEQTDKIGGTWNYTDYTYADENGMKVHSSMYQGLKTNLPKDCMEFQDLSHDEQDRSFIDAKDVLKYIHKYASKFQLLGHIKFLRHTILVEPLEDGKWRLTEKHVKSNEITEYVFDAIMVCTGHNSVPKTPSFAGCEHFDGKAIHSHYFRKADAYKGKRVLLIGAGPSGVDIANILTKTADKVYLSYGKTLFHATNDTVIHKPLVDHFENNKVIFKDGSEELIDNIIYCTGYVYEFSFLSPKCGITVENNWVKYIYKHIVNVEHPTMAFLGIPSKICPFPAFDIQVLFFLELLQGSIKVSKEEMMNDIMNDINAREDKPIPTNQIHHMGMDHQQPYLDDLSNMAKIIKVRPVIHKLYKHLRINTNLNQRYRVINDEEFIEVND